METDHKKTGLNMNTGMTPTRKRMGIQWQDSKILKEQHSGAKILMTIVFWAKKKKKRKKAVNSAQATMEKKWEHTREEEQVETHFGVC